jgi:hypothetical protein
VRSRHMGGSAIRASSRRRTTNSPQGQGSCDYEDGRPERSEARQFAGPGTLHNSYNEILS